MEELLQPVVELATNPGSGIVALTWLIMTNTVLGIVGALLRKEFAWNKFLNFLGSERVLYGGILLALIYAGLLVGLPLLPFYAAIAGAIALSTVVDIVAKVGNFILKK